MECQKCRKYQVDNRNNCCWKDGLNNFPTFADNIWSKVGLNDFHGYANAYLYTSKQTLFILQVTEFKDKWFKECSPIFDEKCKTK